MRGPGSLKLHELDARLAVGDYVNEIIRLDVPGSLRRPRSFRIISGRSAGRDRLRGLCRDQGEHAIGRQR